MSARESIVGSPHVRFPARFFGIKKMGWSSTSLAALTPGKVSHSLPPPPHNGAPPFPPFTPEIPCCVWESIKMPMLWHAPSSGECRDVGPILSFALPVLHFRVNNANKSASHALLSWGNFFCWAYSLANTLSKASERWRIVAQGASWYRTSNISLLISVQNSLQRLCWISCPSNTIKFLLIPHPASANLWRINSLGVMGGHDRPLFDKLLWGLVTSTTFVHCKCLIAS